MHSLAETADKRFLSFAPGFWPNVVPELWNDWKWQLKNRVTNLQQLEQKITLTREERAGVILSGNQACAGNYPSLFQSDRPRRPKLPDPSPSDSAGRRVRPLPARNGRPMRRRFPYAGPGTGPSISGSRALSGHRPVRVLLPLLHPKPRRQRRWRTRVAYRISRRLTGIWKPTPRSGTFCFQAEMPCSSPTINFAEFCVVYAPSNISSLSGSAHVSQFSCRNESRRNCAGCSRNFIRFG